MDGADLRRTFSLDGAGDGAAAALRMVSLAIVPIDETSLDPRRRPATSRVAYAAIGNDLRFAARSVKVLSLEAAAGGARDGCALAPSRASCARGRRTAPIVRGALHCDSMV
jgi:hypothetical protein